MTHEPGLFGHQASELAPGARHHPGFLDAEAQRLLLEDVREVMRWAPLYRPSMPRSGKPFSVLMTNCGTLGWVSDRQGGYRYQPVHPTTGRPWPAMPGMLLEIWRALAPGAPPPEAGLVNYYEAGARMGLHRDEDEEELAAPVVSLSLGDDARFRVGGMRRSDPTRSVRLASGDAFVLSGPSRLAFHGIDRLYPGTSRLLDGGGRINVTLRRVTRAGPG